MARRLLIARARGERLLTRLRPALVDVRSALVDIRAAHAPGEACPLLVSRLAAVTVLGPKLGQFARDYPDVVLDVVTSDSRRDLVAGRFDAGIHFGVLEDWCPPFPGFFLCYPSRRHQPAALVALIQAQALRRAASAYAG